MEPKATKRRRKDAAPALSGAQLAAQQAGRVAGAAYEPADEQAESAPPTAGYKSATGVSWEKKFQPKPWKARLWRQGTYIYLGLYKYEGAARAAYDAASAALAEQKDAAPALSGAQLAAQQAGRAAGAAYEPADEQAESAPPTAGYKSTPGVSWERRGTNPWKARLYTQGTTIGLGLYNYEGAARAAYDAASAALAEQKDAAPALSGAQPTKRRRKNAAQRAPAAPVQKNMYADLLELVEGQRESVTLNESTFRSAGTSHYRPPVTYMKPHDGAPPCLTDPDRRVYPL
eukprot:COSAG02_NODE_767_length_17377_cov_991.347436_4_plen_288_part_00